MKYNYFDKWIIYSTLAIIFKLVVEIKYWWIPLIVIIIDLFDILFNKKDDSKTN